MTPKKTFTPTAEQIRSAELVFNCMALIATIRPVVEGYQRRILEENRWPRGLLVFSAISDGTQS